MRCVALVGLVLLCACTGRALRVDAPDAAVTHDLAPYGFSTADFSMRDMSLDPFCSQVCGQWDHCVPEGGIDYPCNVQCDAQVSGYVCLLGCDPTAGCATFLDCVSACGL